MPDAKKPYNALTDMMAPLRGVKNIVSGRVFDPLSWNDEKDIAFHNPAPNAGAASNGDASEEVEESTTRRVRRGPRGTFTAAGTGEGRPAGKGAAAGGNGGGAASGGSGSAAGASGTSTEGEGAA